MTTASVDTGGGTYVGKDVAVGHDFVGRDLTIQGIPPEEHLRLMAQAQRERDDALRAMQEAIQSNQILRTVLIAGKATWQVSYGQIDRIGFAKEMHDLLQRIALAYNLLHPILFEHNSLRPATEWRWIDVQRHCTALKTAVRNLLKSIAERQPTPDPRESWVQDLQQCGIDLDEAVAQKSADVLDSGLAALRSVLDTQPTRYNSRMGEAVDAMDAPRLIRTLGEMGTSIAGLRSATGTSIDVFLGYVAAIYRQVNDLTQLRNEHHGWQGIDDRLQMEYAQLYNDAGRFRLQWQKRIGPRLQDVVKMNEAALSSDVDVCIAGLETSFASGNIIEIRQALWDVRSAVSQRFNEVDYDFKRLCSALDKTSRPLGETIAGLN